jgi:hypothetical protein
VAQKHCGETNVNLLCSANLASIVCLYRLVAKYCAREHSQTVKPTVIQFVIAKVLRFELLASNTKLFVMQDFKMNGV